MNTFNLDDFNRSILNERKEFKKTHPIGTVNIRRKDIGNGIKKVYPYDLCRFIDAVTKGQFVESVGFIPMFEDVYIIDNDCFIHWLWKCLNKVPNHEKVIHEIFGENSGVVDETSLKDYMYVKCGYTYVDIVECAVKMIDERYFYSHHKMTRKPYVELYDAYPEQ